MLLVGLTGGIGAGKSTAARMFAALGATVVDADALARNVTASSSPQFPAISALFPGLLLSDGELDRPAVAAVVFADPGKLRALEAIVHPVVEAAIEGELVRLGGTDSIVVLDSPLLLSSGGWSRCDAIVVVTCSIEHRLERLAARGMTEADARARMAAQADVADLAAHADYLLDNDGTQDHLRAQVARVWVDLEQLLDQGSA